MTGEHVCPSVCRQACLGEYTSNRHQFVHVTNGLVSVFLVGVVIYYVLPVLWITSYMFAYNGHEQSTHIFKVTQRGQHRFGTAANLPSRRQHRTRAKCDIYDCIGWLLSYVYATFVLLKLRCRLSVTITEVTKLFQHQIDWFYLYQNRLIRPVCWQRL